MQNAVNMKIVHFVFWVIVMPAFAAVISIIAGYNPAPIVSSIHWTVLLVLAASVVVLGKQAIHRSYTVSPTGTVVGIAGGVVIMTIMFFAI